MWAHAISWRYKTIKLYWFGGRGHYNLICILDPIPRKKSDFVREALARARRWLEFFCFMLIPGAITSRERERGKQRPRGDYPRAPRENELWRWIPVADIGDHAIIIIVYLWVTWENWAERATPAVISDDLSRNAFSSLLLCPSATHPESLFSHSAIKKYLAACDQHRGCAHTHTQRLIFLRAAQININWH